MPDDKLPGASPAEKPMAPAEVEQASQIEILAEPPRTEGDPGMDPFAPPSPTAPKTGGQG